MSNIDQKLTEMRNGLTALSDAIEAVASQPAPKPKILNRSLTGDHINGGKITNFSSVGIADTATDTQLRVSDDGITITVLHVNRIANPLTVQGELTVEGAIRATRLDVDEISADVRNERTSNLEFKAENGSILNKGLVWTGQGNTRSFVFQGGPDRFFSSDSIDIFRDKEYRIGNVPVLSATNLGLGVIESNLQSVGTLRDLAVAGRVTIDEHIVYDPDSMRLGIGTAEPNGAVSVMSLDHEFVIDPTEDFRFKIGTWTTSGLDIITDDTKRISIDAAGTITVAGKTIYNSPIGVGVNNFATDADITTAGPVRFQGKKQQVGSQEPQSGAYVKGDIVWNSDPRPTGYVGWICVREGTPGEWKPFGQISA